jgi:hypothetical protein
MGRKRTKQKKPTISYVASKAIKTKREWFWVPVPYGPKARPIETTVDCWYNSEYYTYEESINMVNEI